MTTKYKDLAGYSYKTEWQLNPFIYEHRRYVKRRDIGDLVGVVGRAVEVLSPDESSPDGQDTTSQRKVPAAERYKGSDRP